MKKWKILARHRIAKDIVISESINLENEERRFVATICGWRNWKLWKGNPQEIEIEKIVDQAKAIKARILSGDQDIFFLQQGY